ncbi:ABC transporter ATP-binding protein/permease [Roseburia sp. MSJ-14]|uniref:ABC transporter ATP-binding protein/permease n=1 Tax=Roseburia sp. MSJ-14 TaxID=2841514 RepID=UPI001C114448|nr:ABC transporter ATP-binding protein/permease [Roseburia sp. MSJ-14]MBU5473210.1 ABC transporter ATP-binding protein/permease [Roseburia sp. MSJ-14]
MFHKRLLQEFRDNNKYVVGMVITQWVMLLANVCLMFETAKFVSAMVGGEPLQNHGITLLAVLGVVVLVRGGMSYLNSRYSFQASKVVKERLRTLVYEKLMRLGSSYRKEFQTSEVVQISTEGVEQLEIYFGKYVPQFFYSMLAPITLFIIVGTMNLKVAVVLLVCVPLIPVSIVAVQKFAKKMLTKYWGTYTELGDSFLECLQGLTTLKIYQADERYAKKMDEESEKFRKVTMRVLIMQLNSISIMDLVAYGGAAAGIILSILEYKSHGIDLAQCFFIIMISAEFFLPLRLLGSFFHIAMNGNAAADKIFRLIDLEEEPVKEAVNVISEEKGISLEKVVFSYEPGETILQDITVEAKRGLTALVGESGCGKSTITALIMGEQKPQQGRIQIGGVEQSQISSENLRKRITRIRHDSYLFAGTIRENLKMGKEDATEEEMCVALKQVNLLEFVTENGGLDYVLLEKASNLSGGQKQRLALARALLHNSEIYIFDEATSNVDVESENDIMEVVKELAKTKTVLLISHRLANVVAADRIYVLKEGKVIEQGQHEELYRQQGYYQKLFQQQSDLEQFGKEAAVRG